MANLYRLYIDESGTHHYSTEDSPDKRYLGLTGIIVETSEYSSNLQPRINQIKKLFSNDPDNLPILHREDIVNKRGVFGKLNDPEVEAQFNQMLLELVKDAKYCVLAVVIDKKSHLKRYQKSAEHPYHYCLTTMLERYLHFLETRGKGDVMAESRGKIEDMALKRVYGDFYGHGTYFCTPDYVQTYLTSKEIKIKSKDQGVQGLEMADLMSLATKLDVLSTFKEIPALTDNFNKQITDLFQAKYCRGNNNPKIVGYGKKLL